MMISRDSQILRFFSAVNCGDFGYFDDDLSVGQCASSIDDLLECSSDVNE